MDLVHESNITHVIAAEEIISINIVIVEAGLGRDENSRISTWAR
jgi:hypothetical protein